MILFNIAQEQEKFNGKFKIKIDEGTLIDEGGLENNLFEVDVYLKIENIEEDNYLENEFYEETIKENEEFEYENDEEQFEDI